MEPEIKTRRLPPITSALWSYVKLAANDVVSSSSSSTTQQSSTDRFPALLMAARKKIISINQI
jgi:hypothetical protein